MLVKKKKRFLGGTYIQSIASNTALDECGRKELENTEQH